MWHLSLYNLRVFWGCWKYFTRMYPPKYYLTIQRYIFPFNGGVNLHNGYPGGGEGRVKTLITIVEPGVYISRQTKF